jgi:lipopolysaccharide export system protein LptA
MTRTSSLLTSLRCALGGFVVTAAALGGIHLSAQTISGHNSDAPVNYAADQIELQDRQNRVVLSGNVDITQGDLRLQAARTTVAYTDEGSLKIQRIDASGGVVVTRGGESARGNAAVYDFGRRLITMAGDVSLRHGGDTLNGSRLTIDLATGISRVDGRAGGRGPGRVSGSFSAPK